MELYIALNLVPSLIMTSSIHQHGLIIIHELQELNKLRESIVLLFLPHVVNTSPIAAKLLATFVIALVFVVPKKSNVPSRIVGNNINVVATC